MERDQRVPRRPPSRPPVGVFTTGITARRSLSRHAGQGTPTSGQFSRWGPAPLRAAQRDGVYHAAVRMTLNAGVPAEKGPPRNWGSFPPPAFGGLCRPEVGVPLPARRTALLGFSRGAAFTQQLSRLERRSPTGIARERETRTDDTAPCQRECRTPSQHRMPRSLTAPLPAAAPLLTAPAKTPANKLRLARPSDGKGKRAATSP